LDQKKEGWPATAGHMKRVKVHQDNCGLQRVGGLRGILTTGGERGRPQRRMENAWEKKFGRVTGLVMGKKESNKMKF